MRLAVMLVLVGCGRVGFDEIVLESRCTSGFGPWGNVERLDQLSTAEADFAPALHPNGLVLVWDSVDPSNDSRRLMISTRASSADPFGEPSPISELNDANDNQQPGWTRDGRQLHFHRLGTSDEHLVADYLGGTSFGVPAPSDLPEGDNPTFSADDSEVWFTTYGDTGVGVGHAIRQGTSWVTDTPSELDTVGSEGYPGFDETTQTIYLEHDVGNGRSEITAATRTGEGSPFGTPVVVPELEPGGGDPEVSSDGTTMIFISDRTDNIDLYIATRRCR